MFKTFQYSYLAVNDEMYQSLDNIFTYCLLFLEMSIMPVVGKLSRFSLFFFYSCKILRLFSWGSKRLFFHGDRVQNSLFIFAGISERIIHGDPLRNPPFFFYM